MAFYLRYCKIYVNLPTVEIKGILAEWLGRGLQNLVQRFESARCLLIKNPLQVAGFFMLKSYLILLFELIYSRFHFFRKPALHQ